MVSNLFLLTEHNPGLEIFFSVSALTHIMQIHRDFYIANSPWYCDDNTLPHIARFRGEFQETVQK